MSTKPVPSIKVGGADATVLTGADRFALACDSGGCSRNCCTRSAPIVLNPYEIAMICIAGELSYDDLLDLVDTDRAKGFPLVMLPRDPACPFWTESGCRIYHGRPLACRLFPLGRVFENGSSYLVSPDVNTCGGLIGSTTKTVSDYLLEQETAQFISMADRWIAFVTEMEAQSLPDAPVTSVAFHMLVYSPDAPPAPGESGTAASPEDRFLLRLKTAREQLPRFLRPRGANNP